MAAGFAYFPTAPSTGWFIDRGRRRRRISELHLISLPVSPFAARVRLSIYAKALQVEIVPPPAGWPNNPQFRDISPMGRVPVLILEDGEPVWESAVILEFLEDAFPGAR